MIGPVYFYGGFTGSMLFTADDPPVWIWPNYGALALGREGKLRLGPDRHSPGPPDGVPLVATLIVGDYYAACLQALRLQLDALEIPFFARWYDWRLSYLDSGAIEAPHIIERYLDAGQPLTLIAHSFGGLFLRGIWAALVAANMTRAVRRIITIGTGHQGVMSAARFLSEGEPSINGFLSFTKLAAAAQYYGVITDSRAWTILQLQDLFSTFPSLLELMPTIGAPMWVGNEGVAELYDPAFWPEEIHMTIKPLNYVKTVSDPATLQARTRPPYEVLTTVGGTGFRTAVDRAFLGNLTPASQFIYDDSGDTFVPLESALMSGSKQYIVQATHGDLPNKIGPSGQLLDMILDERPPLPPPYPQETLPVNPLAIAGPYPYQPQQYPGYPPAPAGRRGASGVTHPAAPMELVIET